MYRSVCLNDDLKVLCAEQARALYTDIRDTKSYHRSSAGASGTGSPRRVSAGATLPTIPQAFVDDTLMEKLGDMAVLQEAAARRQEKQARRSRSDARSLTQPVTLQEVQQASAYVAFFTSVSKGAKFTNTFW